MGGMGKNEFTISSREFMKDETEFMDDIEDTTQDTDPDLIGADMNPNYRDNEIDAVKEIRKEHVGKPKTVLDETLGDIMDNTLSFMTYSGDKYMKSVYKAEDALSLYKGEGELTWKEDVSKHVMAVSLFCRNSDNAIYLGIILIFVSLIIYFLSIVSPTKDVVPV